MKETSQKKQIVEAKMIRRASSLECEQWVRIGKASDYKIDSRGGYIVGSEKEGESLVW